MKNYLNRFTVPVVAVLTAAYIILLNNRLFWSALFRHIDLTATHYLVFSLVFFIALTCIVSLVFMLFSQRFIFKPFLIVMLIASAAISYYQTEFGVIIDQSMIQNIVETDYREATELMTAAMLLHIVQLAIIPAIVIWLLRIQYKPMGREIVHRSLSALFLLFMATLSIWTFYKDFSLITREHRELRLLVNPTYPIYSVYKYYTERNDHAVIEPEIIARDAKQQKTSVRTTVAVLVLGETARADNFSLMGYDRKTNPNLEQENVITFTETYACGTSTAESVPCIFSHLEQADYSPGKASHYTNVLDVLTQAGVSVLWRDNNSGCKGVCSEQSVEDVSHRKDPALCTDDECYDEILLSDLDQYIANTQSDVLIVLHQKGSHGPAYFKRHPAEYTRFKPECTSHSPQDCSQKELLNAYDNTILYTDYFLHETIEFLKDNSDKYNTLMVYVSDHGESLGENGLYLHGLPYFLAPDEQKHIPMIAWLSDHYIKSEQIDPQCLTNHRNNHYSHDNIFHTLLGAFNIRTTIYKTDYDIFYQCRNLETIAVNG